MAVEVPLPPRVAEGIARGARRLGRLSVLYVPTDDLRYR
jgi:hypothetical protein